MTNDEFDVDAPEEPENLPPARPSLREMWDNNPILKPAAIVLVVVLSIGGYMTFSKDDNLSKSIVRLSETIAKQVPGQQELDPAYRKALEESNKKAAEAAALSGGSALPTPIGTSKIGELDIPAMPEKLKFDPLSEWRKATEGNPADEQTACPPKRCFEAVASPAAKALSESDIVPMLQPIRPQQQLKPNPKAVQLLADQMRTIVAAQAPAGSNLAVLTTKISLYTKQQNQIQEDAKLKAAAAATAAAAGTGGTEALAQTIVPAGSIAYVQLLNELNSDVKGPVLAQILSGPFAGGRAIGKMETKMGFSEYMVLTFNRVVKDAVSYGVNGIAMDENTTLTGQATDVDHHYFMRIVLPAAAAFIEGYSSALAETGSSTTQTAASTTTSGTAPSAEESVYKGVEEASKSVSNMLAKGADRPVTVIIAKGTAMGMLFLDPVTTKDAGK